MVDKFLSDIDLVIVMVKHDEIKNSLDKLKDKIVLDTQNVCGKSENIYKL